MAGSRQQTCTAQAAVHELFRRHAEARPHAPAVVCGDRRLSYEDLDAASARLANYLAACGVKRGDSVAVLLPRSPELIVTLLAVLRAGGAYMPLDPSHPAARLTSAVTNANPAAVVTDWATAGALGDIEPRRLVLLDAEGALIDEQPAEAPTTAATAADLAYLMHTSGSTGRPKTVGVTHGNVANLVTGQKYACLDGPACLAVASAAFDASTFELWGPLCNGGTVVVLADRVPSLDALRAAIDEAGARTAVVTTSLFNVVAEADPTVLAGLDEVLVGGEALSVVHVRRVHAAVGNLRLANVYGPTECTTFTTSHAIGPADLARPTIPIGTPLAGVSVHLVDDELQPVEPGTVGEICISGAGVARGYVDDPAATALHFVPDPFSSTPGGRMYRSGDLARRLPDDTIDFVGRRGEQVKVRGHRVEPGEIEAVLAAHPGLAHAAVVAVREGWRTRLVAYVVPREESGASEDTLRSYAHKHLPQHMVPHAFVMLRTWPLTTNGKLDRDALPPPPPASRPDISDEATDTTEEVLAAIWSELLAVDDPTRHDDFFALGGDSLTSIRMAAVAAQRGLTVPVGAVYSAPTLARLAQAVRTASFGEPERGEPLSPFSLLDPAVRARLPNGLDDAYPLSVLQAGMLFHSFLDERGGLYDCAVRYRFIGPGWHPDAFRSAVDALVARHPALRTTFDVSSFGEPVQLVHRSTPADVMMQPRRRRPKPIYADSPAPRFDWRARPPIRVLVRPGRHDIDVTLQFHHALLDGWSTTVLFAELAQEYGARVRGVAPNIPSPEANVAAFVALERQACEPDAATFWGRRLEDAPGCRLTPAGHHPRLVELGSVRVTLDAGVADGLRRQARRLHLPAKALYLAAHAATVGSLLGSSNPVVGAVSHGRPETGDGDRVLGMFLNTLPARLHLAQRSWADAAIELYDAERLSFPYRRYPFARMVHDHGDLFDWVFNYTHFDRRTDDEVVRAFHVDELSSTNFAFATDVVVRNGSTSVILTHDTTVMGPAQAAQTLDGLTSRLRAVAADPHVPIH